MLVDVRNNRNFLFLTSLIILPVVWYRYDTIPLCLTYLQFSISGLFYAFHFLFAFPLFEFSILHWLPFSRFCCFANEITAMYVYFTCLHVLAAGVRSTEHSVVWWVLFSFTQWMFSVAYQKNPFYGGGKVGVAWYGRNSGNCAWAWGPKQRRTPNENGQSVFLRCWSRRRYCWLKLPQSTISVVD